MNAPSPKSGCLACEALRARVAELESQLARVPELERQAARVAELETKVAALTARLDQNSGNSSRPPSTDPPWKARPTKGAPSGRKKGGQKGHTGHTREFLPEDRLTDVKNYIPTECPDCHVDLPREPRREDPQPRRHQVWEIPYAPPEVIEHRRHGRICSCCGKLVWAELPEGVSQSGQGPRLESMVVLLTGAHRLSRRAAAQFVKDVWEIPLCAGTVSRIEKRIAESLEEIHKRLGKALTEASQIHSDETTWWHEGKRQWLWIATTKRTAYYHIDEQRSRDAFERVFDAVLKGAGTDWDGVLGSDRYSAYAHWPTDRHQHCLAHVKRDLAKAAEHGGQVKANASWAQGKLEEIFREWRRFVEGEIDRSRLLEVIEPYRTSMHGALSTGARFGTGKTRGMMKQLLKHWEKLWVFLYREGVEPTNNRAERGLRGGVIWRTTSFGSQSTSGKEYVERMLSVVGTARLRGQNVLDYLTAVVGAELARKPIPDLQ